MISDNVEHAPCFARAAAETATPIVKIKHTPSPEGSEGKAELLLQALLAMTRVVRELNRLSEEDWSKVATSLAESVTRLSELRAVVSGLNPRQREALQLLLHGKSEKEAGQAMGLSVHTVHIYAKAIYAAFSVSTRAELLARWVLAEI